MENLEQQTNEFDDVLAVLEEERQNASPRYISLPESIFGEMRRISREKVQQIRKMEGGETWD